MTNVFLCLGVPLPEVQIEDAEVRLREVTELSQKMRVALGAAVGTLWYQDPVLRHELDGVLMLLQESPMHMGMWLFSSAFEGARQVLASVWAHFPDLELGPLVRTEVGDRKSEMFFEDVREKAKFAAGACKLQAIIEKEHLAVTESP